MNTTIRPVTMDDSRFLWNLAMDPSVREMSTRSEEFPFEQHDEWLWLKLRDGLNAMWVIEEGGVLAGQVRYGANPLYAEAEIAISVSPTQRNKGLALELLSYTMPLACAWLRVERLVALVLHANVPSQKLFLSAGFKYVGQEERMGKAHLRYEWSKE